MNILLVLFQIFCAILLLFLLSYRKEADSKFGFWMNFVIQLPLLASKTNLNRSLLWVFILSTFLFTAVNSEIYREVRTLKTKMITNAICGICIIACLWLRESPIYLLITELIWIALMWATLFIKDFKTNQIVTKLSLTLTVALCCMVDYINVGKESKYYIIGIFIVCSIWLAKRGKY